MIIANKNTSSEIEDLAKKIEKSTEDWKIVSVTKLEQSQITIGDISERLNVLYENRDGFIMPLSEQRLGMVVKMQGLVGFAKIKGDILAHLPQNSCYITIRKLTQAIFKTLREAINNNDPSQIQKDERLYKARMIRKDNVFLVVDDDRFINELLGSMLSNYGDVHSVYHGDEAIKAYQDINPDVAILDLRLPGMDGFTIIDELYKIDPHAFAIITSGDANKDNVMKAITSGAAGFLAKPINEKRLVQYLEQSPTTLK